MSFSQWMRTFAPPLILAAVMMGLIWSPILIPAFLARNSDDPFSIVDAPNTGGETSGWLRNPLPYLEDAFNETSDFLGDGFLMVAGLTIALGLLLIRGGSRQKEYFLLTWFFWTFALTILAAGWVSSRYLMPSAGAFLLAMILSVDSLGARLRMRRFFRFVMVVAAAVWIIGFAIPFFQTALQDPQSLPLDGLNEIEYLGGSLIADEPDWQMAETINALAPPPGKIYGTRSVCRMVYFFTDYPLTCLPRFGARSQLARLVNADMGDCESAHVIVSGYPPSLLEIDGLSSEKLVEYVHVRMVRPVQLWRIWWREGCGTP
jgi:hypothetical protein